MTHLLQRERPAGRGSGIKVFTYLRKDFTSLNQFATKLKTLQKIESQTRLYVNTSLRKELLQKPIQAQSANVIASRGDHPLQSSKIPRRPLNACPHPFISASKATVK